MVDTRFPSVKEVELTHTNADKDGSPTSLHHTLGNTANQASPGDHSHDGGTSKTLDNYSDVAHTHGAQQTQIRAKISPNADQGIANVSVVAVIFNATNYDTDAMADLANNRLVVKTAGWYRLYCKAVWSANATGYRAQLIYVNGVIVGDWYMAASPAGSTIMSLNTEPIQLAVNDQIAMRVVQGSGATINLTVGNARYGYLAAELISYT